MRKVLILAGGLSGNEAAKSAHTGAGETGTVNNKALI